MSDLFFTLSKILWVIVSPDHLLLLLLTLGLLLAWRGRRGAKPLLGVTLACWLLIAIFPVGNVLLRPLETRFPQAEAVAEIGGIIVLGGGEDAELSAQWQQPQFNAAAERVMVIPELLRQYPDLPLIFSGGSGSLLQPEYRGADAVQRWLAAQGLAARALVEPDARNTHENARYSRMLAGEIDKPWLLVTSAYHMPRAVGVFRQQEWPVLPYPVDYYATADRYRPQLWRNLRDLTLGAREWLGLVVYYLTNKTTALFPAPETDTDV